jgi:hypothetical protein
MIPKFDKVDSMFPGSAAERREAAERELQQRQAERQKLLAAQQSPKYDPQRRIELWEHIHGMLLPRIAEHRLVDVIAKQTALTVEQVRHEQVRRATITTPAGAE